VRITRTLSRRNIIQHWMVVWDSQEINMPSGSSHITNIPSTSWSKIISSQSTQKGVRSSPASSKSTKHLKSSLIHHLTIWSLRKGNSSVDKERLSLGSKGHRSNIEGIRSRHLGSIRVRKTLISGQSRIHRSVGLGVRKSWWSQNHMQANYSQETIIAHQICSLTSTKTTMSKTKNQNTKGIFLNSWGIGLFRNQCYRGRLI